MIEQAYCLEKEKALYGWNAIYDKHRDKVLEAGVILCCNPENGKIMLFELAKDILLFIDSEVKALPGSIVEIIEGHEWKSVSEVPEIPLKTCRFPTKEELKEYEDKGFSI